MIEISSRSSVSQYYINDGTKSKYQLSAPDSKFWLTISKEQHNQKQENVKYLCSAVLINNNTREREQKVKKEITV